MEEKTKYGKSSIRNKLIVSFLLIILLWGICISLLIQVTLRQYLLISGIEEAIADNILRNFTTIGLGLVIVAILLSILIAFFLSNYITRPIKKLAKTAEEIGKGRLDIEIDHRLKEKNDEIGDLASAFSQMTKDLKVCTVSYDVLNKEVEERKRIEQELRETQDELIRSEKLAGAAQIAGEVAHEIKNPLAVIRAGLYYLNRVLPKSEDVQNKLFQIDRATEKATSYIDNLLSFSRPPILNLRKVKVNEVIEESLEDIAPEVLASIEIEKGLSPDLPEIDADPERLKQVFINIIKNAGEAMEGGGKLRITSSRLEIEEKGFVQIAFEDNGQGIPEKDLEHIFDPFFTTKSKGTGLGLAICQRIIEAHNGKIEIKSKPGEGTTFVIRFKVNV